MSDDFMWRRRELYGDYDNLLWELHREDRKGYKTFIRITQAFFEEMVERITPAVIKQDTKLRKPLPVGLILAVTLRFLATGNSYTSLGFSFRTSTSAISLFVPLVCQALLDAYKPEVMRCSTTPEEWNEVARQFSTRWNYHNCGGALDGKHVAIRRPDNAGSQYFNYKKFHSVILLALADAQYKFLFVDVGAEGGAGDAGTWWRCNLHMAIEKRRIGFPVFSYRLSRARRVVENAFGILQMRWRVFGTIIHLRPTVVRVITLYACVLHNFTLQHHPPAPHHIDREDQKNYNLVPGSWREQENLMQRLIVEQGRNPSIKAKTLRNYLVKILLF
ncbi:putative nuclease HARBI1 [Portunus trituberculatus]|uniref:putative nuclease HARBI1 n=1 Tax=Portunus trituberculatus TaxID=210409 RepID=UPI001E1CB9D5|nr:putative nuclease HARBI1 [Portunus trituberculatus]